MSFEPVLQRDAANKIIGYVERTFPDRAAYEVAISEIHREIIKLAVSPKQAVSPPGLFETRPIHQFTIHADGTDRDVRICFRFDSEDSTESALLITDFVVVGPD